MDNENLKHLESPVEYFRHFALIFKAMRAMNTAGFKESISPAFSEKISLAVSGVTKCAYCTWLHTKTSLEKGMSEKEIKGLLDGDIKNVAEDEAAALFYAQHRADFNGGFSPQARQRIVDYYGEQKTQYIDHMFNAVYFGNLCSNTVYSFKNNLIQGRKGLKLRIVYMLSLPVAFFIKKAAE